MRVGGLRTGRGKLSISDVWLSRRLSLRADSLPESLSAESSLLADRQSPPVNARGSRMSATPFCGPSADAPPPPASVPFKDRSTGPPLPEEPFRAPVSFNPPAVDMGRTREGGGATPRLGSEPSTSGGGSGVVCPFMMGRLVSRKRAAVLAAAFCDRTPFGTSRDAQVGRICRGKVVRVACGAVRALFAACVPATGETQGSQMQGLVRGCMMWGGLGRSLGG